MQAIDDARAYAVLQREALKRVLMRELISSDASPSDAWPGFAGPVARREVFTWAFSQPELKRMIDEWRQLAGRLGLQSGRLLERHGAINQWLDPAFNQVRRWFRSGKGFTQARAGQVLLEGAVSEHFRNTFEALIPKICIDRDRGDLGPWRSFVRSDERGVMHWFHAVSSSAAEVHFVEAVIALTITGLRAVPGQLRDPNIVHACLMSARSSASLDRADRDQVNVVPRLCADLAKLHSSVLDDTATRAHLVTILQELIRVERFLANELRWEVLRSNHGEIAELFNAMVKSDADRARLQVEAEAGTDTDTDTDDDIAEGVDEEAA